MGASTSYQDTIPMGEGGTYSGFMDRDGRRHGRGTLTAISRGEIYNGEWDKNHRHGQGTQVFQGGDMYIGEWEDNMMHGVGIYTWARNGCKMTGQWENGMVTGYGELNLGNGKIMMGTWSYNQLQRGVIRNLNDDMVVEFFNIKWRPEARGLEECPWGLDEPTGLVVEISSDSFFMGMYMYGLRHGPGVLWYASDKTIFAGSWERGQRHGIGYSISADGHMLYSGEWKRDVRHGVGVEIFHGQRKQGVWDHGILQQTCTFGEESKSMDDSTSQALDCKICIVSTIDCVYTPCGHAYSCHGCSENLKICPVCRSEIECKQRLIFS